MHKYAYVHGDPIQGIDPTGMFFDLVEPISWYIEALTAAAEGHLQGFDPLEAFKLGFATAILFSARDAIIDSFVGGAVGVARSIRRATSGYYKRIFRRQVQLGGGGRFGFVSETRGAVTNLGTRTAAENAELLDEVPVGGGMSGVYDHKTGTVILRPSSDIIHPLPDGWVMQTQGHRDVRADLEKALGEDLVSNPEGRPSGFAIVKNADGTLTFKWNSGVINPDSHGGRAVPAPFRPEIEETVKTSLGLNKSA